MLEKDKKVVIKIMGETIKEAKTKKKRQSKNKKQC